MTCIVPSQTNLHILSRADIPSTCRLTAQYVDVELVGCASRQIGLGGFEPPTF